MTRDEFLLRDFLINWLFPTFMSGAYRVRTEDLYEHLRSVGRRGGTTEHAWSETTLNRVAAALLKMAVDFGLLRGSVVKEFASYHLPERSFLYLLYALREEMQSPRKVLESEDWRMFLMRLRMSSGSFFGFISIGRWTTRSPAASSNSRCPAPMPASMRKGWWHERSRTPHQDKSRTHTRSG